MAVKISYDDFKKLIKLLEKESQGGPLTFDISDRQTQLKVMFDDKIGGSRTATLTDTAYNLMPTVTKKETF